MLPDRFRHDRAAFGQRLARLPRLAHVRKKDSEFPVGHGETLLRGCGARVRRRETLPRREIGAIALQRTGLVALRHENVAEPIFQH